MRIERVAIDHLLSFDESVTIGPFGPVAALIGKNNVGKSNVFRAVGMLLKWHGNKRLDTVGELEKLWHGGTANRAGSVTVELDVPETEWPSVPNSPVPEYRSPASFTLSLTPALGNTAVVERLDPDAESGDWSTFLSQIASNILIIAAQRRTVNESPQQSGLSPGIPWDGQGFKYWLNKLDTGRSWDAQQKAALFRDDLHNVAGMENLQLSVHAGDSNWLDVLVHDEGTFRASLEDCGTGVQTVILVLSALHRAPGTVVLLDDPETHLHPAAQATFARVVAERASATSGQVIFATHSPAVLDAVPSDQVFEVTMKEGASRIRQLTNSATVLDSIRTLGYRPSLLQMADAVLFLEGPTDQAAIRAWWRTLFKEDPEPQVALLPAGGDCMRHLDIQAIRALGRQCFALFDSDRTSRSARPKTVATDFQKRMGDTVTTHVLRRRELENYLSPRAIAKVSGLRATPRVRMFDDVSVTIPNFSKGRVGAIARSMRKSEIPTEIRTFLEQVRASTLS